MGSGGRFIVTFQVDATSLSEAFDLAQRQNLGLASSAIVVAGPVPDGTPPTTGLAEQVSATTIDSVTRAWSHQAKGDAARSPGKDVLVAFTVTDGRGVGRVIVFDARAEPQATSVTLSAARMADLVRAVREWPLELMDELAVADLGRRRGGP